MATALSHQRCYNHVRREAAARCPECHRYFCRECITEHEDRVLCAGCLEKAVHRDTKSGHRIHIVTSAIKGVLAFMFLWAVFYFLGALLLETPSAFHDTTLDVQSGWFTE